MCRAILGTMVHAAELLWTTASIGMFGRAQFASVCVCLCAFSLIPSPERKMYLRSVLSDRTRRDVTIASFIFGPVVSSSFSSNDIVAISYNVICRKQKIECG